MAKTKLALSTVDIGYTVGKGAIGVAEDNATSIGVQADRANGLTGDPRIYSYADGKVLYYGSLYAPGNVTLTPNLWVYTVSGSTWTAGSDIGQATNWPDSINGHGAVTCGSHYYVISWDEATVIKVDPSDNSVKATYDFNNNASKPNVAQHRGVAIAEYNGNVYALFASAVDFWGSTPAAAGYASSTLVRLDQNLTVVNTCTGLGKNACALELNPAENKFYVACMGGPQQYGYIGNTESRLDAVDSGAMTYTTKLTADDLGDPDTWGDFRSVAFTENYAYLMTGNFASNYTTFTGYVWQFDINDFTANGWTGGLYNVSDSGSVFAIVGNDNNHIWLVRGTHVELCSDGNVATGNGLTHIADKMSTYFDTINEAFYFNSATLLMEADSKRGVAAVAKTVGFNAVHSANARTAFAAKAEKVEKLKAKIKSKKK